MLKTAHPINHRKLIDQQFESLYQQLAQQAMLSGWLETLPQQVENLTFTRPNGKRQLWLDTLAQLPDLTASVIDLNQGRIRIGQASDANEAAHTEHLPADQVPDHTAETKLQQLRACLEVFIPWRKGPFELFGIHIDTEWRSDWKWQRIAPHLADLSGRSVLDVGCGSGYHLWRMAGAGARQVLGIDPSLFFLMQFQSIKRYIPDSAVYFLPLRSEDLPDFSVNGRRNKGFDTVFSMGVLYHRRSPLEHLQELKNSLRPGGELVLETLVVDGDVHTVLMPEQRYGKMRNVWFIPSVLMLELWLRRLGFCRVRTVDVTQTSTQEQRSTAWMRFESLADFLDPAAASLTIEGYPAPKRAVLIAHLPD